MVKEKSSFGGLTGTEADELALLGRIHVNDAVATRIVKDHSKIGLHEIRFALEFNIDRQVTSWIGEFLRTAANANGVDGNGSETGLAIPLPRTRRQIRAVNNVERLRVIANRGFGSRTVKLYSTAVQDNAA